MKLRERFENIKKAISEFFDQDIKDEPTEKTTTSGEWQLCFARVGQMEEQQKAILASGKTGQRGKFESGLAEKAKTINNEGKTQINKAQQIKSNQVQQTKLGKEQQQKTNSEQQR